MSTTISRRSSSTKRMFSTSVFASRKELRENYTSPRIAYSLCTKSPKIANANTASVALNKSMKEHVLARCSMHNFRHFMRDRLRAVECPADIVDQIGGWQTDGVGQGYRSGYPLIVLRKWTETATDTDVVYGS